MSVESAIHAWVVAGTGVAADRVRWADQGPLVARPASPGAWVSIREEATVPVGRDWIVKALAPLTFADLTVSAVDASTNILTVTAHGLQTGDGPVYPESDGTFPGGLSTAGVWAIRVSANELRLAATFLNAVNGSPIDIASAGSGALRLASGAATLRAGAEVAHTVVGLRTASYTITVYGGAAVGSGTPKARLESLRSYSELSAARTLLAADGVHLLDLGPSTPVSAVINVEWEPRATMVVRASVPNVTAAATGTIIETVETQEIDDAGDDVGDPVVTSLLTAPV